MSSPSKERSSWILPFLATMIVLAICFVLGELMVRFAKPQESKFPRQSASAEYGIINYANTPIIHTVPGVWEYRYTTNRYGHRGADPIISNRYAKPNIVVLGDSFTFGQGVHDGEELPAAMQRRLGDKAQVVNLGMPGWGLTQEIRRYYELGQVFLPSAVVLVFCDNDPIDNLRYPVTKFQAGAFVFQSVQTEFGGVKRLLSTSWIQKSQLYNFLRSSTYELFRNKEAFPDFDVAKVVAKGDEAKPTENESVHVELLQAFAQDLKERGTPLIMVAVNGQLKQYPYIEGKVKELNDSGLMRYVELMDWTGPGGLDVSPEGHWGAETQRVNGEKLADLITRDYFNK